MSNRKLFYPLCFLILCFVIPARAQESGEKEKSHPPTKGEIKLGGKKDYPVNRKYNTTTTNPTSYPSPD